MRNTSGLTLLETVVAIAICGIVLGALATVSTSALRESRQGNHKTQATQVLDTLGRRIAGGLDPSLLLPQGESLTLTGAQVDALMSLRGFREGAFEATIVNQGDFALGTTRLHRYVVEVCYDGPDGRCVRGVTLGRQGGN